ncbi:MAG TPA: HAMP domain-containing sensor histidine kinase [Fimbriiglobus sp.]|nr:HAMP domain-containing sensor histidine kinase [Fimbriiglobus sp.]
MSGVPVGYRAVGLAWLPPSADALLALAADPPDPRAVARDPATLAHVLRFVRPTADPDHFALTPALLTQPSLCDTAATLLDRAGTVSAPEPDQVDRIAAAAAAVAAELALRCECCAPAAAFAAAKLAPLGWYAVRAVEPRLASACLDDPADPVEAQRRRWGLPAAAITRRLAARWRLPPWLSFTVGFLRLEVGDAAAVGAPDGLFRIVQFAVAAAEATIGQLGLTGDGVLDRGGPLAADALALAESAVARQSPHHVQVRDVPAWVIARLLRTTAQARRATGAVWLAESEARVDRLADELTRLRADFQSRVRDSRLEGLAEFAAGASHEINNPLAVIRGHAQLLLAREDDPDRRRQLEAIVRQTRRVHDLLHGTLQFARPPRPAPLPVRATDWIADVVADHEPDAAAKGVSLECDELCHGAVWGKFDPAQASQALGQLIRNAVEAAPPGGWVRVSARWRGGAVVVAVEDSGPGPAEADLDHLFNPFFSGREAGRGRGLGLTIAWRLAQVNGGDVRYAPANGGPTRFVLELPASPLVGGRKSA